MMLLVLALAAASGRPLFYWGSRPAVITAEASALPNDEAQVTEVHAALDKTGPVLRFTFDRPVAEAIRLPDGSPVSGRLRAVLYLDADDDRSSGLDQGGRDLRTGADLRLEIGVVTVAADPEEKRAAAALITATLASLAADGRRRTLWRADDAAAPASVSGHGEWLELRLPAEHARLAPRARLILSAGERSWDGRIAP